MDHAGPFVLTERGHKYVGAIICGYSKYTVFKAVKDQTSMEAVQMMREFIAHYGKRTNRVLLICLASITEEDENRDWDEKLLDVKWAIDNCEHKVTKRTSY